MVYNHLNSIIKLIYTLNDVITTQLHISAIVANGLIDNTSLNMNGYIDRNYNAHHNVQL